MQQPPQSVSIRGMTLTVTDVTTVSVTPPCDASFDIGSMAAFLLVFKSAREWEYMNYIQERNVRCLE